MSERHEPPADLAQRIERAAAPELDRYASKARRRTVLALGAALAVPALFFAARLALPSTITPPQRTDASWLAQRVGPDGRFEPASWSGPRAAESGMHGLALLALAREPGSDAAAVARAGDWLLAHQRPDGSLADADQDHAVATLALLQVSQRLQDPKLRAGAEAAVSCLVERLADAPRVAEPGAKAEAAWSLEALLAAQDAGLCADRRAALDRARSRLQAQLGGPMPRAALAQATLSPAAAPRRKGLGELYVATVAMLSADATGSR
jgi:hypothetical protein